MRWPGQQALELEVERAKATAAEAQRMLAVLVEQNAALTRQLASMKRDGFDAPPQHTAPAPVRLLPSKVLEAIKQRARPRSKTWGDLESVALDMLGNEQGEDEIVADILAGEDPDSLD